MKILYIETSSKNCSVAVSDDENLISLCEEISENCKHSENLHIFIEWVLEGADIKLEDIEAVCLGKGPGSYTGLRIGAASAKGFSFGLSIPLVAVNSLDAMVEPYFNGEFDYIIPMIDARRMEVYTKVFDGKGNKISPTQTKILNENSFSEYKNYKVLFLGDGCKKSQEILKFKNSEYKIEVYPSAKYLIRKGVQAILNKNFEDIAYFEPFYLKEFYRKKS